MLQRALRGSSRAPRAYAPPRQQRAVHGGAELPPPRPWVTARHRGMAGREERAHRPVPYTPHPRTVAESPLGRRPGYPGKTRYVANPSRTAILAAPWAKLLTLRSLLTTSGSPKDRALATRARSGQLILETARGVHATQRAGSCITLARRAAFPGPGATSGAVRRGPADAGNRRSAAVGGVT